MNYSPVKTLVFLGIIFSCLASYSQEISEDLLADSVLYKKTMSGGVVIHTQGFGIFFQKGKNASAFKNTFIETSFVGMKSPKQIRSINPYFTNAKSYVYGKLNNVFMLRGGIGQSKQLNKKPYFGGLELRMTYSGGISLGIAKPVYLYIINFTSNPFEYNISTEKYDQDEHFYDNIYGRAPFTKGFDQIKLYPGIYGRFGFSFEFGPYKSKINRVDFGAILEVYPKGIPIMAFTDAKNTFLTLFISYAFGKRYNTY